jgi:peptidoglycan-N-acetylglucosamine deacetylase
VGSPRANPSRSAFGRAAVGLAILLVLVAGGYAGRRLWLKSDDLLRPVLVARGDDAAALVRPTLGARVRAVLSGAPSTGPAAPGGPAAPARLVALTFDDGPYPVTTPLLVQTLRELRVPATFFLIGRDAEQFPALVRAIAAGGNEIADHTLTHPDLDRLGDAAVRAELDGGAAALERIVPDPAVRRLFRPPHGRYTLATVRTAQAAGFDTVLWNDDPGDWRSVGGAELEGHLLRHATAPEVVLLHSGRVATIALLPDLVERYRRAGYTFVTVGALLRRVPAAELNHPAKLPLAAGA